MKAFDEDLVHEMVSQMKNRGIQFHFNIDVDKLERLEEQYLLTSGDFSLKTGLVICATGRIPNIEELSLENTDVQFSKKGIQVNERLQTNAENIYACGDVLEKKQPKLTPVSVFEATYLVDIMVGKTSKAIHYSEIPTLVYGSPKLAQVGISSHTAKADSENYRIESLDMTKWFSYARLNEPIALSKIILNNENQIVGASLLSNQADDLINGLALAIEYKMTHEKMSQLIMGYPTIFRDMASLI